jgi:hypothetical protein
MPDLSDLLGDVYGEPEEEAPPAPPTGPGTPEWADDEHLDRAFSEWTPGPGADAPAAERDMFAPAPASPATRLADDLAAALSEAVLAESAPPDEAAYEMDEAEADVVDDAVTSEPPHPEPAPVPSPAAPVAHGDPATAALHDLEPVTEPTPVVAPAPVHQAGWQRSDDDILPTGRAARGGVRLPRPRAGKAPKAPKGAKGPEAATAPKKERKGLKGLASMELSFGKKKK